MDEKIVSSISSQAVPQQVAGTVTIRPMIAQDVERVHLIDTLSFNMPWPASSYRYELFENSAALLHVAEIIDEQEIKVIVGMIVTWLIVDEAHIATIAVHPNYRRLGIGRKLLTASLTEVIQRGAKLATLEVRQGNQAASNLYTQFGFVIEGRRPRYYHDTHEDAIIMTVTGLDQEYLSRITELEKNQILIRGGHV